MVVKEDVDYIAREMGRRIASVREARGLKQADLAARTGWTQKDADAGKARGLSPSRIGNYEQGTRRIGHEEAELLASALEMPAGYFLVTLDEHEARVIAAMRTATPPLPRATRKAAK